MQAKTDICGNGEMGEQRVILEYHADVALFGRQREACVAYHFPLSRISPAEIGSNPAMQRNTVVLPQPLGPSRQPISPFFKVSDKSFTTACLP